MCEAPWSCQALQREQPYGYVKQSRPKTAVSDHQAWPNAPEKRLDQWRQMRRNRRALLVEPHCRQVLAGRLGRPAN